MLKTMHLKRFTKSLIILIALVFVTGAAFKYYPTGRELYKKIQLFSTILDRVHKDYVDEKDPISLIDDAIRGMVSNLDPHTAYMTSEDFSEWNQRFEGYSGIGVTYDVIRDKITILSIMPGGPSEKAGLMQGDRIVGIEGESAVGLKRDEVPLKLMGPKGTKVKIAVERRGWPRPRDFMLIRDELHVQSIPYAFMIQPGVAYISIIRFSATTGDELELRMRDLQAQGMKQLILDLRNNGGGYLEAAVEVADKFMNQGKRIVYTRGRIESSFREFFASGNTHPIIPLVILINRASASASEIVSGAVQDWDRGVIVGETSFGKGLVQSQYRFPDGSALLMTTAQYYTPSGRLIQMPYDDMSLEEYYETITNDSIRAVWERDRTSRPRFRTQILKRNVYGGGGITPDLFFKTKQDTLSQVMRRLLLAPDRHFFSFVEDYLKDQPQLKEDFNDYLRNYKPNGNSLQKFLTYLRKYNFEITDKEFADNLQDIRFFLKQSIANKIWGDEARFKVQLLRDRHLLESLEHLPVAEEILNRAYGAHRGN